MTTMTLAPELMLPWESSSEEDKRFYRILQCVLVLLLVVALIVPFLQVEGPSRAEEEALPTHLARVIIEKKELPKPEPVKPEPRVVEKPKPVDPPKPKTVVKKPVEKPVNLEEVARDKAKASGVLAFQDELMDMRESVDVNALNQTRTSRGESSAAKTERSVITGAAKTSSGGIQTAQLSRDTGGAALSGHETTRVESGIADVKARDSNSASAQRGGRSDASIRREMDQNKGAIFAIYNRALRKDPLLEGKLVFEMVIDASGNVTELTLLSSELSDEALTRKILSRIRMIRFQSMNVISTRVNYSFDFLPFS